MIRKIPTTNKKAIQLRLYNFGEYRRLKRAQLKSTHYEDAQNTRHNVQLYKLVILDMTCSDGRPFDPAVSYISLRLLHLPSVSYTSPPSLTPPLRLLHLPSVFYTSYTSSLAPPLRFLHLPSASYLTT